MISSHTKQLLKIEFFKMQCLRLYQRGGPIREYWKSYAEKQEISLEYFPTSARQANESSERPVQEL